MQVPNLINLFVTLPLKVEHKIKKKHIYLKIKFTVAGNLNCFDWNFVWREHHSSTQYFTRVIVRGVVKAMSVKHFRLEMEKRSCVCLFRKNAIKCLLTHGVTSSNGIFETKNPRRFCYLADTFRARNKRKATVQRASAHSAKYKRGNLPRVNKKT